MSNAIDEDAWKCDLCGHMNDRGAYVCMRCGIIRGEKTIEERLLAIEKRLGIASHEASYSLRIESCTNGHLQKTIADIDNILKRYAPKYCGFRANTNMNKDGLYESMVTLSFKEKT